MKLKHRFSIGLILVAIVNMLLIAVAFSKLSSVYLLSDIRHRMHNIVSLTSTLIDPDLHEVLTDPSQENSVEYREIQRVLQNVRQIDPDIREVYTMRVDADGTIRFVVDAETQPDRVAHLNEEYFDASETLRRIASSLDTVLVEQDFYKDHWGTWLTGYAPIRDRQGNRIGIVGVDLTANYIRSRMHSFLFIGSIIFLAFIPITGLMGWMAGVRLTRPLQGLTHFASRLSKGELDVRMQSTGNSELGILTDAFNQMTENLSNTLQSLQTENRMRKEVEQTLLDHQAQLEDMVQERTREVQEKHLQVQESEIKYRSMVERLTDLIIIIQDETLVFVNSASQAILNYRPEDLTGQNFTILFPDRLHTAMMERYRKRMAGQPEPELYETILRTSDGEEIPVEIRAVVIEYQGSPADLAVVQDILMRKEKEAIERTSEDLRREAEKSQLANQLAITISHEFRNPMAIIQAAIEVSNLSLDNKDVVLRHHNRVCEQINRMDLLVERLLNLEQYESVDYVDGIQRITLDTSSEHPDSPRDNME